MPLSHSQIQFIKSLQQKKFREQYHLYVAETPKVVEFYLKSKAEMKEIYAVKDWIDENWKKYASYKFTEISQKELERISGLNTPNQILAVIEIPCTDITHSISDTILVLDDIRDPGNLGTIIRIADWFGIENIVCSSESVEYTNPKTVQAAMGSIVNVKIAYCDLHVFLSEIKIPIYGSFMDGESIYETKIDPPCCIIIGNEAHGISADLEKYLTKKISIPSFAKNKISAESLNAAIATAVFCTQMRR
ncbi:MAG: RNA methyltransferase [Bacteroidales bacterium]|jgi:TrmH family RNA methyltransferase|nr:RNA methyltransferase [Bacteroidales bacterium]